MYEDPTSPSIYFWSVEAPEVLVVEMENEIARNGVRLKGVLGSGAEPPSLTHLPNHSKSVSLLPDAWRAWIHPLVLG